MFDVAAVDAQHQLGPGFHSVGHLVRVEAVEGDAVSFGAEGADGFTDAGPGGAGIAAEVDDVGAGVAVGAGQSKNVGQRQTWSVVDLGEDGDVMGAIAGRRAARLAEELGQVAQVFRAAFGGAAGDVRHRFEIAGTQARQDDAVEACSRQDEMIGDPGGGGQGDDGDGQHGDVAGEAGVRRNSARVRRSDGSASLPVTKSR